MEKPTVINITEKIFLLIFENQYDITSTFLRFQEYYESPKFRGKVFTLSEFQKWYTELKWTFSYYTDWNGFNIPSYILTPFYAGEFNPLSKKEQMLLNLFDNIQWPFYIIGVHKSMSNVKSLLAHELSHGLFYTDTHYHNNVMNILSEYDTAAIKTELGLKWGYHEKVLDDEVHAYSLGAANKLTTPTPEEMAIRLQENYQEWLTRNKVNIPEQFI